MLLKVNKCLLYPLLFITSSAMASVSTSTSQLDWATTFGSLLLVIVFILFLAWLLKRMRVPALVNQKGLRVIGHIALGHKEKVMVIQAGEEQFLIGVTTQSIQLISKLEHPLSQEEMAASPFASQLTQLLKNNDKSQ